MIRRCILAALLVIPEPALADWVKIGPGPNYDYADAYCDNAAMGAPQEGYFVMGSPLQVGMAEFGAGLGAAIRRSRYKKNCMTMLGWKNVASKSKSKAKTNWNSGKNR